MLRNFRAGIEAGISTLKRAFGLDRCTWSGWRGFKTVCVEQHCFLQFTGAGQNPVGQSLNNYPISGNDPLQGVVCLY